MCFFLGQVSEGVERAEAVVRDEGSLGKLLGEPFRGKWMVSFLNCVKLKMCMNGIYVSDDDVRIVIVKSGLMSGELRFSLQGYDGTSNVLKTSETEECLLREQSV